MLTQPILAAIAILTIPALFVAAAAIGAHPLERAQLIGAKATAFLFAFSPLLYLTALYALSFRIQALIGHWPINMRDYPNTVQACDPLYRLLDLRISNTLEPLIAWSLLVLPLHAIALRNSVRWRFLALLFVLYFGGYLFLLLEPGQRFAWWLD